MERANIISALMVTIGNVAILIAITIQITRNTKIIAKNGKRGDTDGNS